MRFPWQINAAIIGNTAPESSVDQEPAPRYAGTTPRDMKHAARKPFRAVHSANMNGRINSLLSTRPPFQFLSPSSDRIDHEPLHNSSGHFMASEAFSKAKEKKLRCTGPSTFVCEGSGFLKHLECNRRMLKQRAFNIADVVHGLGFNIL